MKVRKFFLFISIIFSVVLCSCSEQSTVEEPDVAQLRSICKLSTLECYYHNVAKGVKEKEHKLEKERIFWIEYTGVVKIGIDVSKMSIEQNGNTIKITIPPAEVISSNIVDDSLTDNSFYISSDGLINKNKIKVEDQKEAIFNAEKNMEESASSNTELLEKSRQKAKKLIENYVNQFNGLTGSTYTIEWVDAEKAES